MSSCITPFIVKNNIKGEIPVPCGKCPNCLKRRISGWSFRLMQEEKISMSAHFITLTYDTQHVPITRNGFMDIRKRDVQLFFKRLRKSMAKTEVTKTKNPVHTLPIKYYVAGEYGGKTKRPHYHAIIFNCKPELIEAAWQLGSVHYGQVSVASVGYTLKYMSKPKKIPMHKNDDRTPEFSLMSKGLGASYLSANAKNWHMANLDDRMHLIIEDGKKIAMPRYYKDKIYTEEQRKRIAHFQKFASITREMENMLDPNYLFNKTQSDICAFEKLKKDAETRNTI